MIGEVGERKMAPMSATSSIRLAIAVAAVAFLAMVSGGAMLIVDRNERDDEGYFNSDAVAVSSSGYAVATDPLEIGDVGDGAERFVVDHLLGRTRIEATSTDGKPILIGVAKRADLDAYLANVASTRVTDIADGRTQSRDVSGSAPSGAAAAQPFWTAVSTGSGRQAIDWHVGSGDWTVAVLNADGSQGVSANVVVGADSDVLRWLGFGVLGAGVLMLGAAAALVRRAGRS